MMSLMSYYQIIDKHARLRKDIYFIYKRAALLIHRAQQSNDTLICFLYPVGQYLVL